MKPSRLPRKPRKIKRKSKKWRKSNLKDADAKFSRKIRARDKHCQFYGCTSTTRLQCSHYISRANKSTRFDEDNCITLCWYHHYGSKLLGLEYQKQREETEGWDGQYTLLMKRLLGIKWFALIKRAKKKLTPKQIKELILKQLQ